MNRRGQIGPLAVLTMLGSVGGIPAVQALGAGVDRATQERRDKHFPPGVYPSGVLEEAERQLFTPALPPDHVELMHPERWEKALGLAPGQLRALPVAPEEHPATRNERKRPLAEKKTRRAKRKQRRQR